MAAPRSELRWICNREKLGTLKCRMITGNGESLGFGGVSDN